jgi:hypothetical protein
VLAIMGSAPVPIGDDPLSAALRPRHNKPALPAERCAGRCSRAAIYALVRPEPPSCDGVDTWLELYSASWAREGATNQATTRMAKLMKAAAIMSWLLRMNQRDPVPLTGWKSMEGVGGDQ